MSECLQMARWEKVISIESFKKLREGLTNGHSACQRHAYSSQACLDSTAAGLTANRKQSNRIKPKPTTQLSDYASLLIVMKMQRDIHWVAAAPHANWSKGTNSTKPRILMLRPLFAWQCHLPVSIVNIPYCTRTVYNP